MKQQTKIAFESTNMEIVRAKTADANILAKLNKLLIEDERHPSSMTIDQLTQRMKEWLENGYIGYLVKQHGCIVAYCLYRDEGNHYYMRQLYVKNEHRRRGFATRLLNWLYENAWTDKKVRLDVLAHNEEAVSFYKRYGFRVGVLRMEK